MKVMTYVAVYEHSKGIDVFVAGTEEERDQLCANYDNEPDDGSITYCYCTKLEREIEVPDGIH